MPRSSDEILALKERVQELEQQYAEVKQELSEIRKLLPHSFDCSNLNIQNDLEHDSEEELMYAQILSNECKAGFRTAEQARRKTKRVRAEAKMGDIQILTDWYFKVDNLIDEQTKYGKTELRIPFSVYPRVNVHNQSFNSPSRLELPCLISKDRNTLINEIESHYEHLGYSVTKDYGRDDFKSALILSWK